MNEEKILEAIEKTLLDNFGKANIPHKLSKEILTAIRPLLPPSDLVKVWEGSRDDYFEKNKRLDFYYDILSEREKVEMFIREVKS